MSEKTMIAAISWVSRGFAKRIPIEHNMNDEEKDEYNEIVKE